MAKLLGCIAVALIIASCSALADKPPSTGVLSFTFTPELSQKLIVFVHGVFGDPSEAWTNRSGVSWPDLIKDDKTLQDFTVATYRYDTPYLQRSSSINEIAGRMLRQLEDQDVFGKYNEIYFIAHSMGGLVVKRVLVDLNRQTQIEKLHKVKAVLYISTPAQGAKIAEVGSWFSSNPQLHDMHPADDFNTFVQALEDQWQNLLRDRGSFPFPRSFCAHETKPTHGIMIVSRVYAVTSCDQNSFAVDEDHANIVKPSSAQSDIYTWARARILETSILAQGSRLQYGLWKTPYNYRPGLNVEGVEWKETFREYHFSVKNPSKTERVVDLRLRFEFPWPAVVSRLISQQGCEGLVFGSDHEPVMVGSKDQIRKVVDVWTNVLEINVTTMFPEAVFHGKLILITDGPPSDVAMLRADYRDGNGVTRKSVRHRISVLDAATGTVKIQGEELKGKQKASIMQRFKEPIELKGR